MKFIIVFLSLLLLLSISICGQTRTLTGKVIDEQSYPLHDVRIYKVDTTLLLHDVRIYKVDTALLLIADEDGSFKLHLPIATKSILVNGIGREWMLIDLLNDCSNLEIIMLNRGTYDFMSLRKVDKLRKKQFDNLPQLHQIAYEKGVFKKAKPCYELKFLPYKQ